MADYISRETAIRAHCDGCVDDGYCGKIDGRYACEDVPNIMAIPAADVVKVVRGKWIDVSPAHIKVFRCDQCGEETMDVCMEKPRANFCPNCGAKMDGGVNDATD